MERRVASQCKRRSAQYSGDREPKKRSRDVIQGEQYEHPVPNPKVTLSRISCPVKGCRNCGGKGYKRSYIFQHLKSHVAELLASQPEREELNKVLSTFSNHICCKKCCHVVAQANAEQVCIVCAQNCLPNGPVTDSKDETAKMEIKNRIRSANQTHLRILSDIPRSLEQLCHIHNHEVSKRKNGARIIISFGVLGKA